MFTKRILPIIAWSVVIAIATAILAFCDSSLTATIVIFAAAVLLLLANLLYIAILLKNSDGKPFKKILHVILLTLVGTIISATLAFYDSPLVAAIFLFAAVVLLLIENLAYTIKL